MTTPDEGGTGFEDDAPTRIEPLSGGPTTPGLTAPPSSPPETPQPLKIGRYTVLRRLGQGGMGVVYTAYDDELDRRVAIKLLLSRPEEGSLGRTRLQREAQALAKLSHPNVIQVYETASYGDQVYLVMEYVEGVTLRQWRTDMSPTWRDIIEMYIETGKGLAAAHQAGLIHRDFKPVNVIVADDGRPRILDFGLARAGSQVPASESTLESGASLRSALFSARSSTSLGVEITQAGTLLGTPAYMAPEQLFLGDTDARCDVYAFSVALWESLYGARPYAAKTIAELRLAIRKGPPSIPSRAIPAAIGKVLLRGLAVDRDKRYPDILSLLRDLTRASQGGRRLIRIASLALAALALVLVAYTVARADSDDLAKRCADAGDLEGIWDAAIARDIEAQIAATGLRYSDATWAALEPRLDRYAAALGPTLVSACIAREGYQGKLPPALSEQTACLERRKLELKTTTALLLDADTKIVENALSTVSGLAPLEPCADLEDLAASALRRREHRGSGAADEERWGLAEGLLVEAQIAQRAGKLERGERLADEALVIAESLSAAPLRAAALHRLGTVREHLDTVEQARADLDAAFVEAEAVGDDRLAAEIAIELLRVDGIDYVDASAARSWTLVAEAKLRRAGEDPRLRIVLDLNRGIVALDSGESALAAVAIKSAVALASAHQDAHPRLYVSALNIYSSVQKANGDLSGSEATLRQALSLHAGLTGPEHPYNAMLRYNIGVAQLMKGDPEAARETFAIALKAREAVYGPQHTEVSQSLNGLAAALAELDRNAEAIPMIERALAIDEAARGVDHPELIYPLCNLADVLTEERRLEEAVVHLRRAQAILEARSLSETSQAALIFSGLADVAVLAERYEEAHEHIDAALVLSDKVHGLEHPNHAELRATRAKVNFATGDTEAAFTELNAALALLERHPDHVTTTARLKLLKAEKLWPTPARRPEAVDLVRSAKKALSESDTNDAKLAAKLTSWLRTHSAPEEPGPPPSRPGGGGPTR